MCSPKSIKRNWRPRITRSSTSAGDAWSCDVRSASDGGEGLDALVAHGADVAFIDIGLPTLDGYAVAAQARARGVTAYLVAMTGYGQPEDRRRASDAGFDLHLTKPVTARALRDALDAAAAAAGAGAGAARRERALP